MKSFKSRIRVSFVLVAGFMTLACGPTSNAKSPGQDILDRVSVTSSADETSMNTSPDSATSRVEDPLPGVSVNLGGVGILSDTVAFTTVDELIDVSDLIVVGMPSRPMRNMVVDSEGYFVGYSQEVMVSKVIKGDLISRLTVFSTSPNFENDALNEAKESGNVVVSAEGLGVLPQVEGVLFLQEASAVTNQIRGSDGWWITGLYQGFVPLVDGRLLQDKEPRSDVIPGETVNMTVHDERRLVEGIDGLTITQLEQLIASRVR
ncbi:MAG: hypothetical protein WC184_01170 [Acidimicrobiia bacterium]